MNFLQLHFFFWMGAYIYTDNPRFLIMVGNVCALMIVELVFSAMLSRQRQAELD
jgi:hypothetical protein